MTTLILRMIHRQDYLTWTQFCDCYWAEHQQLLLHHMQRPNMLGELCFHFSKSLPWHFGSSHRTGKTTILPLAYPVWSTSGSMMFSVPISESTYAFISIFAANHNKEMGDDDASSGDRSDSSPLPANIAVPIKIFKITKWMYWVEMVLHGIRACMGQYKSNSPFADHESRLIFVMLIGCLSSGTVEHVCRPFNPNYQPLT